MFCRPISQQFLGAASGFRLRAHPIRLRSESRPQNGSTVDPSALLGISPAGSRCATPAKRLNLTKLFAFFLPKWTVFLRSLSATIAQAKK
jgi:hypothetical protein